MMQTDKFDNLYTPLEAVLPLTKYLNLRGKTFWECCDFGKSLITEAVLTSMDYEAHAITTDIIGGFDFLTKKAEFDFDMIITNPPYSLKDQFLERCYEYGKPFALLLPLTALEGIKRGKMFREHGIELIVLDKRIDFTGKGANLFNVSWFCWQILPKNTIVFEKVE